MSAYITDLTHFLTADGAIAPTAGPAKRLAENLTALVVDATTPSSEQSSMTKVNCWHRPGKKRCAGVIDTAIAPDGAIEWQCPDCGNYGTIRNWQGTLWDRSGDTTAQ